MTPKRIQRKLTKGWMQPPNTLYMGLKGWRIGFNSFANWSMDLYSREDAVRFHKRDLEEMQREDPGTFAEYLRVLRQYDYLSCWCPLDQPCHVDNWIEFL